MTIAEVLPTADQPVIVRLRRIEGQARGLQRMYLTGRPAEELLAQIASVRAALGAVGLLLVEQEVARCLGSDGPTATQRAESVDDLLTLVHRLVRCT